MGNLVIYRASAGTGKTFTLAVEYIKLLIQSPGNYRNILAVTFTNKATAEMKERILSQLYGIANQLPDSDAYFQRIDQDLGLGEMIIRENARVALHNILHDYSFFHVETIDSFFQTVMRNLAHELQLSNNLTVDLDQKAAIAEAVDEMMEQLTPGTPEIEWIMEAIADQIDNNKNWNISRPLKDFAQNLFAEPYQKNSQQLNKLLTNEFTQQYKKGLRSLMQNAKEELMEFYHAYKDSLEGYGMTGDWFANKNSNGFFSFFNKIGNGVTDMEEITGKWVQKFLESPDNWPNKALKGEDKNRFMEIVRNEWHPMMTECFKRLKGLNYKINTCSLLLKNMNELRLLNVIHSCMIDINQRTNRFLLADTNQLLNSLIQESDAPFIFEKLGTQLKHVMIDEFQDTSRMQWNNFRSLLVECLSSAEESSLIVGDIKQSIYRWRNGDWSILANMDREQLPGHIVQEYLDTNRRSMGNIIYFNNLFFENLRSLMLTMAAEEGLDVDQIAKAYEKVEEQKILKSKRNLGYVNVTLINTNKGDGEKLDYAEETLNRVGDLITGMREKGISYSDMAILVRAKTKNVPLVAKHFSEHYPDIPLVSDEAFKLGASKAIRLIIHALSLLLDPNNNLSLVMVINGYLNQVQNREVSIARITGQLNKEENLLWTVLPEGFMPEREKLLLLPLYELVERIISLFRVNEIPDQQAYLYTFLDELNQFTKEQPNDIPTFLAYWEETLMEKTIPSGKVKGIRIMSIHASKGLEFNHVIIPFCDFPLEQSGDMLWCKPAEEPMNQLPVAPISFSKSMKDSQFSEEYKNEKLQQWIDNMNLLYVAFTRPKCNMYIMGRLSVSKSAGVAKSNVSGLIFHALGGNAKELGNEDFVYECGEFYLPEKKTEEQSKNPLLQQPDNREAVWTTTHPKLEFRQSNQSQQYLDRKQEDYEEDTQEEYIRQGLLLHRIFSTLHTTADVEPVLKDLEQEGLIGKKRIGQLRKLIERGLNNPQIRDWFSNRWKISNECSILYKVNGQMVVRRPDRVMIGQDKVVVVDFKFGKPEPEHHEQVKGYLQLMKQMGYPQVEGYLWYVYKNEIEEVKG